MDTTTVAARVAARVDSSIVNLDPATILTILTVVLPSISKCLGNEATTPSQQRAKVAEEHASNPKKLLKRTMRRVRSEARPKVNKAQATELAKSIIAEALESSPEEYASYSVFCKGI